jgi:hypothetical protein
VLVLLLVRLAAGCCLQVLRCAAAAELGTRLVGGIWLCCCAAALAAAAAAAAAAAEALLLRLRTGAELGEPARSVGVGVGGGAESKK